MNKRLVSWAMFALALASAVFAFVAMSPRSADAAPTTCTSSSFFSTDITGDLVVPAGETCNLGGITVSGNVTVRGSLDTDGTTIQGNLKGDHATQINLDDVTIGGNASFDHTTGGGNLICETTIGGNLTIQKSGPGAYWSVGGAGCDEGGATVGKNFTFQGNQGGGQIGGGFDVDNSVFFGNTVGGNLDCHDNTPAPTVSNNTVSGNTKGQCAP